MSYYFKAIISIIFNGVDNVWDVWPMQKSINEGHKKKIRVWCDGCFDMVHFGHANQLRQAKQLGDYLVVGVHNDADITKHKGPPVFNEQERYRMVRGIKWVDEVVEGSTYFPTVETLDENNCDFCVHGDDISMSADGIDTYESLKSHGRYRESKRTPGISTTELVGRMLLLTKGHHSRDEGMGDHEDDARSMSMDRQARSPWTRVSCFLPSTRTIMQFAEGRQPKPGDVVVYVCGSFDLFHIGHLCFLEEARKLGDYLIVGIHTDQVVNAYKGSNHPIMTLYERTLNVLPYKPVSEVIIGAPYSISEEMIRGMNIQIVANGIRVPNHDLPGEPYQFEVAKRMGIYREIDSGNDMSTEMILSRIIKHRMDYENRNLEKENREEHVFQKMKELNLGAADAIRI